MIKGLGYYTSPIGEMMLQAEDDAIVLVHFLKEPASAEEHRTAVIDQCADELDEYFHRGRKFFTVPLKPNGTTFQQRVWNELVTIPYGRTGNYSEIALKLGDIKAIRAVGLANGQNPIAIIIPCHRVIGKNGDMVGYAGGLEKKEWLLNHEGSVLKQLELF